MVFLLVAHPFLGEAMVARALAMTDVQVAMLLGLGAPCLLLPVSMSKNTIVRNHNKSFMDPRSRPISIGMDCSRSGCISWTTWPLQAIQASSRNLLWWGEMTIVRTRQVEII